MIGWTSAVRPLLLLCSSTASKYTLHHRSSMWFDGISSDIVAVPALSRDGMNATSTFISRIRRRLT